VGKPSEGHHPGGEYDLRQAGKDGHGQQCVYDKKGKLITEAPGAGTPDISSPTSISGFFGHMKFDVAPFEDAKVLDGDGNHPRKDGVYLSKYMTVRPPNKGNRNDPSKECPKNPT
jgi:hypothetical protein